MVSEQDKKTADEITKVFERAVQKELERRMKLGFPSVYMKDGKLCYLLPDGTETFEPPKF